MSSGWRYLAQQLNGDGTATFTHLELPLQNVEITNQLSGPGRLTGTLPVEFASLKDVDGRPVLDAWRTAIFAEADGEIRGGGILVQRDADGPTLTLDCMGFSGYVQGMPYTESHFWVKVDPLDMVREIWRHLQSQPGGNIGMHVDPTTSPLRIGTDLKQVQFDTQAGPVDFESGPYKLTWYTTDDLGSEMDNLAKQTPFDYREKHTWNADRSDIVHRLELGYPTLGRRRNDLSFVVGENINVMPSISLTGDDFANGVMVLGAGEGRDMVRSDIVAVRDGRLRRVAVVTDKSIRTKARAVALAQRELAIRRVLEGDIVEITVNDHPHAPLGSWDVGDEIYVQADIGWDFVNIWCRILSSSLAPESRDIARLTIQRTEKASA